MWNVGVLVMRFHKTLNGNLCKRCVSSKFWEYMAITSIFGWWGVISFFVNLVAIPMNLISYFGAWGLPDEWPNVPASHPPSSSSPSSRPTGGATGRMSAFS
jgi:hypothetical protein